VPDIPCGNQYRWLPGGTRCAEKLYRYMPDVFRLGYRFSEAHSGAFQEGSEIYQIIASGSEYLLKYLTDGQFDTVICTHCLPL